MNTLLTSSIPTVLSFISVGAAAIAVQSNETSLALIDLAGKALAVISTVVLAWLAWKQAVFLSSIKSVKDELALVKTKGEQTHAMVNGMQAKPLETIAVQAHRLADLTKEQGDIDAAVAADTAKAEHLTAEAVSKAIAGSPTKEG